MDERQFELCVQAAVDSLPDELRSRLSNVAIVIDDDAPSGSRLHPLSLEAPGNGVSVFGEGDGWPFLSRFCPHTSASLRDTENVPLPPAPVRYVSDPRSRLASDEYRQAVEEYVEVTPARLSAESR